MVENYSYPPVFGIRTAGDHTGSLLRSLASEN